MYRFTNIWFLLLISIFFLFLQAFWIYSGFLLVLFNLWGWFPFFLQRQRFRLHFFGRGFLVKLVNMGLWMSALSQKWVREDGHSRFWFGCYVINWRGFGLNLVLLDGIGHIFSELGGFLFFALLLLLSGAVVSWKITVLAKSLRVVELLTVLAGPCFFCAAAAVVAVDAHILGIMFSALVGTGDHLPWLTLLAIRAHIRYGLNVHLIFMINVIPRLKIFNTLMTSSFFNLML